MVSGRAVVPELLQEQVTGERLAREAARLLEDPVAATAQRAAFKEVRARLGEPGVGRRAARAVLAVARRRMKIPAPVALAVGPPLGALALRALALTLRVRREEAAVAPLWAARAPVIYVVWHGRILLLPYLYGRRGCRVLASRSRDGEVVARWIAPLRLRPGARLLVAGRGRGAPPARARAPERRRGRGRAGRADRARARCSSPAWSRWRA